MPHKILVIDDEKAIRFAFKGHLSDEGYDVITAEHYDSAIDTISTTDLDLIIADIILGDRTGIDILQEVKNRFLHCPVIMITARPEIDTAADAVRLGAFDYLSKPVQKETLLKIVRHALRNKEILDEKNKLKGEKERYRCNMQAIFGSLNEAVITVDRDMRVIEANNSVENICNLSPNDLVGKYFGEVTEQCSKSCHEVLKKTLRDKSIIKEYRSECRHEERANQIVSMSSSPLLSQDSGFMGAVLVVRDITKLTDLEKELKERHQFHHIIGKSKKMQKIFRLLEDLSQTETTVLITGETGSGKELIAKALHYESSRANKPMVTVNCSALSENLLESELFGHVKGAFTGAISNKAGRFQTADGGTIFLDEIGDLSKIVQIKLLRALQEKEIERVGDSCPIKVDVRIISATHHDLKENTRTGKFREDLYYRLNVMGIKIPPLRERQEDIPLLVKHFCKKFNDKFKKKIEGISSEVLDLFMRYQWPGNVRELEHALEHAFVLCHEQTISVNHLSTEIKEYFKEKIPRNKVHITGEESGDISEVIYQALDKYKWNKTKAARQLGISRTTLYQKIKQYGIKNPEE